MSPKTPKIFPCEECGQDVIWNPDFFNNPHKGDSEWEQPKPILDVDESEHICIKKEYCKRFVLIPGTEYLDFHALNLELGKRIDGFLCRGGYHLCKSENQKVYDFKIETYKESLKFLFAHVKPPLTIYIKAKKFKQEYKLGEIVKIEEKFSKNDSVIICKTLTRITLDEFIGLHYIYAELLKYKFIAFETKEKIKFKKVMVLLLRNHNLNLIGNDSQLILADEKEKVLCSN